MKKVGCEITFGQLAILIIIESSGIVFDVCRNGCMAFWGDTTGADFKVNGRNELLFCSFCSSPRYTVCSHHQCKSNSVRYEDCNPNLQGEDKGHDVKYRISMQKVKFYSCPTAVC